ncbi:perilipin-3 isoform X2 [Alligator mississippiensis]|uniref:perilipin-3 isoform X2 n=1 Tax=Alligator mississippiensis TaxID=8496 RepID=UPI00090760BA|nr:perilipin-3 isoform X2 [Alligator mississippiensis]
MRRDVLSPGEAGSPHSGVTMSDESTADHIPAQSEEPEQPQNVVSRVANLPLVSSTYDMVSTAYTSTKENHPYLKSVCDVAEKGVKTLTSVAVSGAQPLLTKLEPQIATANQYACKGLDKLEEKLPILQQPTEKVVADTKELVSSTVTGARDTVSSTVNGAKDAVSSRVTGVVDLAKGAVQGSVEMTKSVVNSSVNTVLGSRVAQMVVTGVDAVLGKSEELVDHYLPMTDQELAKLATSVEGFEMASVEQQKRQQSYFVRLGSLSSKLRHRAYQHSLGKLRCARQSTQEGLAQLHHTIELIEHVKQGVDQRLHNGQEKLHQMWLEWSRRQPGGSEQYDAAHPEVESRTLVMFRGITQQLQASCLGLMANVQGLPASIQDKVQQMRHHMEELHTSFSAAHSFQDLSSTVLTQSRERVTKARESLDELLDYVAQNAPLPWLVGPFAPVLVEHPENLAIGMEKKEDQATCPGQSREEKPAQQASEAKKAP